MYSWSSPDITSMLPYAVLSSSHLQYALLVINIITQAQFSAMMYNSSINEDVRSVCNAVLKKGI